MGFGGAGYKSYGGVDRHSSRLQTQIIDCSVQFRADIGSHRLKGYLGIMKRIWILAATISGAIFNTSALPAGSVEAGATKAAVCSACHGANGNSVNAEWPSLAGLGADYIAEQLKNFKDGKRSNPVMMPIVANLSADDFADLGAYFGSLTNTGLEADPSYWEAGEKLYRGGDQSRAFRLAWPAMARPEPAMNRLSSRRCAASIRST
jgi:cytochrome c553